MFHILFVNIEKLFYKILLAVIVATALGILGYLWRRAKRVVAEPLEKVLKKTCEQCNGSGLVICPICKGAGKSVKKIKKIGPCKRCGGTGQIKDVCPECMGAGQKKRKLKFNVEEAKTHVSGILRHTQRIAIMLRNLDDKAGYFIVRGTIAKDDKPVASEEKRIFLKAGDKDIINIYFPRGWQLLSPAPFKTFYDITPEVISYRCERCQGNKHILRTCPICQGRKTLTEIKEIPEICSTCEGKKQVTCQTCNGTGKVRRFH